MTRTRGAPGLKDAGVPQGTAGLPTCTGNGPPCSKIDQVVVLLGYPNWPDPVCTHSLLEWEWSSFIKVINILRAMLNIQQLTENAAVARIQKHLGENSFSQEHPLLPKQTRIIFVDIFRWCLPSSHILKGKDDSRQVFKCNKQTKWNSVGDSDCQATDINLMTYTRLPLWDFSLQAVFPGVMK